MRLFALLALLLGFVAQPAVAIPSDWTTPLSPFHIAGNLYYVGSRDLASYLIVTPSGNILINANLASSPAQIRHSVEQLGFRWRDTKILLNSQAHNDHAAGDAAVVAQTGAKQMVMAGDAAVIESGGAHDFDPTLPRFAPSRVDRVLHDGDHVTLGGTTLTAHKTAGHTRGCTTWTLDTREAGHTYHVVIVGGWSLNPGVRLVAGTGKAASYPGITRDFERTFRTLHALPCDIFLGAHGVYFDMLPKLARVPKDGVSAWVDPQGYHAALAEREAAFQTELQQQQSASR